MLVALSWLHHAVPRPRAEPDDDLLNLLKGGVVFNAVTGRRKLLLDERRRLAEADESSALAQRDLAYSLDSLESVLDQMRLK